ncbi:MAG: ATP-dependent helicase [Steroidobacteraceae bacterium]
MDGAAGHGKTHRLMEALKTALEAAPLTEGQRVLALTFMHGSRRRLEDRLRKIPGLAGHFDCVTIDSFAWRLRQRWRALSRGLGLPSPTAGPGQFTVECEGAGRLLEHATVNAWVARSFPLVTIDEAQDLAPERLIIVRALSQTARVLIAADEFQCLDQTLRPNPMTEWLPTVCQVETLGQPRRTTVPELLAAAVALRTSQPVLSKGKFKLMAAPSAPFAAACLASALRWHSGGPVAIITPAPKSVFVRDTIIRVQSQACGKRKYGPFPIDWEESEYEELKRLSEGLAAGNAPMTLRAALQALEGMPDSGPRRQTADWLHRQRRVAGRDSFSGEDIFETLRRFATNRRQRLGRYSPPFSVMTVHQAKNREFAGVVMLWPYEVGGDAETKRRLLYNGVTRAERWCTVIAQGIKALNAMPFA